MPRLAQTRRRLERRRFSAFLILSTALLLSACSRPSSKRLTEVERRRIVAQFQKTIEGVAGSQVWVKGIRRGSSPPHADTPIEVLVEPPAFDAVLAAVRTGARAHGFGIESKPAQTQARARAAEVRVKQGRDSVCRWRIRAGRLARAAIVIDDLGGDLDAAGQLLSLPYPLTFSVLPHLRYSAQVAESAERAEREVMLHLPMEPEPRSSVSAGQGAIKTGMSSGEVARVIEADLDSVPDAVGVNNHMGSRATAQPALMTSVMKVLAARKLYFVDSRTTAGSVALEVARQFEVPAFYRSVFLDDTQTTAYALGQLREFRRVAEQQSVALAIGHPYPTTLVALAKFLPEFERADIELVPVSQLVRLPEVARWSPPQHPGR